MDNYSDGLASGLAIGQSNACNNGGGWGGFGGYGADLLWIIVLFALLGNGGWGFGGNNGCCNPCGGWGGNALGYELGKVATTNDIASGFNNSAVLNSLNELKLGQAGVQFPQGRLVQGVQGLGVVDRHDGDLPFGFYQQVFVHHQFLHFSQISCPRASFNRLPTSNRAPCASRQPP